MKSEKLDLKKRFKIIWIILATILLISILITLIPYSKYKKGQNFAVATMLLTTNEFNEHIDNKKELVKEMYKYFNRKYPKPNYSYGIDYSEVIESVGKAERTLRKILEGAGYDEGIRASHYLEYTNYFDYYIYKNYVFIVFYAIVCSIALIINICYILSRKEEIIINDNTIIYKKFNNKTKQFIIKDITSAETTILKGLKITGNGIKVKTRLLKNNEELKDYIINLISNNKNSSLSIADELEKYKKLLDSGAITQEEYDKKKKNLLNS